MQKLISVAAAVLLVALSGWFAPASAHPAARAGAISPAAIARPITVSWQGYDWVRRTARAIRAPRNGGRRATSRSIAVVDGI